MALHSCRTVGDECLEKWELVGSGGFGRVFKARHKDLRIDVAIKILHDGVSAMILRDEAKFMDLASCEFVVRLIGSYHGCQPGKRPCTQQGIVMEFMEGGSVQSLQKDLGGPPPWPLVLRLAHQVAQGMNFIHREKLMHQDLKPSNVLLNYHLNAKIADFGLTRVSASASKSNMETPGQIGGSYKYMPPEAFKSASYEPVRSFDVYSYGILLWSIVTGKEPYQTANYERVAWKIPAGDRPLCEKFEQKGEAGLDELVSLMNRCWDGSPDKRPTFLQCLDVTEKLLSMHRIRIHDAVGQVLKRRMSPTSGTSNTNRAFNVPLQTAEQFENDTLDHCRITEARKSFTQVCDSTKTMSIKDKAKFVDDNRAKLIQDVSEVMAITDELGDMVHRETLSEIGRKDTISQQKMRVLFGRTLRSGGKKVKAAFYDALKAHHPDLVESLGGYL
ncbi:hypothetical protein PBY51_011998 [Eleginops maclovinus]|uniref:Receptor-interacting serine/threonine-protein kinase 3-like n=1 Tax=Eleginops maclovinus TaxID=56733 RepID=A0AAN7XV30_ELEMC|nr:hypothetical protein PBY51_011998 [Eleginops maclovinus]